MKFSGLRFFNKKIILCILAGLLYSRQLIESHINTELPIDIMSVISGVDFTNNEIPHSAAGYIHTLLLFAIAILFGMSETEKYFKGYGVLEVTRKNKRSIVVAKIVINKVISTICVMCIIFLTWFFMLEVKGVTYSRELTKDKLIAAGIFGLTVFSLMLWQALIEIVWDGRAAFLVLLGFVLLQLSSGDRIIRMHLNQDYFYACYINMSLTIREAQIELALRKEIIYIFAVCFMQIVCMGVVFKRKDIL